MLPRSQRPELVSGVMTSPRAKGKGLLPAGGLADWFGNLRVGQKITLGYGLVLGTVMLGTALGFILANEYQQKAIEEEEDAIEELYQVYQLKNAVFRVRTQQHKLILYMAQPDVWVEKYPEMLESMTDLRQEWIDFQLTFRNPSRKFKDTPREKLAYAQLMETRGDFNNYLNQAEILFKASNPRALPPTTISTTQSQLFEFMHNPKVITLDKFLDDIEHVVEVTAAEYNEAKADLRQAEKLRFKLITASLLLSAVIATMLVIALKRAIAGPIQAVTHIAQQVTEESNFDLQAPITTQDEIGILAASLNRLIQEVKQLLETQRLTNEQLEVYSEILEKTVRERTQELNAKNQSLQQALENFQRTQSQLIQAETMPDLGKTVDEMTT
jgi:HAMP domain-containing protein